MPHRRLSPLGLLTVRLTQRRKIGLQLYPTLDVRFSEVLEVDWYMIHSGAMMEWVADLQSALLSDHRQDGMPKGWPMVTLMCIWVSSLIAILVVIPDHERYQRKVKRIELLLETNCTEWSLIKDRAFMPVHQLIVTKCLPKRS